jgi:hypothetical protein
VNAGPPEHEAGLLTTRHNIHLPNPSSRTMALSLTQPLTEMNARKLPRGKGQPARKADLTAICEPIV